MTHHIGIAALLFVIGGPLLLAAIGLARRRGETTTTHGGATSPWSWRVVLASMLLYVLAFNLVFFIQELFLVVPKAFTPGLEPTLYHNNHRWAGDHPLASLFQGTGALAIFLTGIACAVLLRRGAGSSTTLRLFLIWMAYHGLFQALPQVVVGAMHPQNDVGMAMNYLALSPTAKTVAAFVALASIPPLALWIARQLLGLAGHPAEVAGARARKSFMFRVATLPALLAIPLILLFRVPREVVEVVVGPIVVTILGIAWMQAGTWLHARVPTHGSSSGVSLGWPLGAVLCLLLIFQLVLRPGIDFF